ncbi:hypothetical protein [Chitinimonas naiadis]
MLNSVLNFLALPSYEHSSQALLLRLQLGRGALVTSWNQGQLAFLRHVLRRYEQHLYTHCLFHPIEAIAHAIAAGSAYPAYPMPINDDATDVVAVEDIVTRIGVDHQLSLCIQGRNDDKEHRAVFSPEQAARLLFYIESDGIDMIDPARAIPTMAMPARLC